MEKNKKIIITADGSHTILLPGQRESYHSRKGALTESEHVFIRMGWDHLLHRGTYRRPLHVFEMGFGTGLNALLTLRSALAARIPVHYTTVEAFPLENDYIEALNYGNLSGGGLRQYFRDLHSAGWNMETEIIPDAGFVIQKLAVTLEKFTTDNTFDLIYYDAFSPRVQPGLWTQDIFDKMYNLTNPGGILVTYSAKGSVRRAMIRAGFTVERLPGPPGKREMLRAVRNR